MIHAEPNKLIARVALLAAILFSCITASIAEELEPEADQGMTQETMESYVSNLVGETEGQAGAISFVFNEVPMSLVSDVSHNRMRIVAPVTDAANVSEEYLYAMLISNYHLALDARYALGNGVIFSTYIHPLAELTEGQLESALRQVASLVKTYGETFTSGELDFSVQSRGQEI